MTTRSHASRSERSRAGRYATPVFGLLIGAAMLLIAGLRGNWGLGAVLLAIMAAYAGVLLLLGRRSETVGLLGGDVPDERGQQIALRATALTGQVLVVVIVAMFLWELAHGRDGSPWTWLGALGGLSFVGATAWYARRS